MNQTPDFDSIKQVNPYSEEYWSARSLMLKLGYKRWDYFIKAIQDAIHNLQTNEQIPENHISYIRKKVPLGSGAEREIDDYYLSRFGCYLIAMNGDPRKPEIAAAQVYFAVTTRAHEIHQLRMEQEQRLETRLKVSESFKSLAQAASIAGVLSENFGLFVDAGYIGLHHAPVEELKQLKGIPPNEDYLDNITRSELSAIDFKNVQTDEKLRRDQVSDEDIAINRNIAEPDVLPDDIRALVQRVLTLYETASDPFLGMNLSTLLTHKRLGYEEHRSGNAHSGVPHRSSSAREQQRYHLPRLKLPNERLLGS